jgi:hypothetical protein
VRDADRPTLIRRIAFDLTGLPPTPDEVKAFVADQSPDAVKRVIDMYLDSERFGERWARHWLDVARYGESSGKEVNVLYPHAWRYRDYVIESFKKDKPYDQFLKEQIAGDLMKFEGKRDQAKRSSPPASSPSDRKDTTSATGGSLRWISSMSRSTPMSQSMLGLTLACARCHDHKFDPGDPARLLRARGHLPEQRDALRHLQPASKRESGHAHRARPRRAANQRTGEDSPTARWRS